MTDTTDRLAEVLHQMATFQDGNAQPHTIALINELADIAQAQQAEIERLTRSGSNLLNEKHREAAEARLWFAKAQEWKSEIERKDAALREARDTFNHYGELHAAKPDKAKADANYAKAATMHRALNPQPGKEES